MSKPVSDIERAVFGDNIGRRRAEVLAPPETTEDGIGSPGRCNENHFAAIRKTEGPEAERRAREAEQAAIELSKRGAK